jgi:hypothetical protein
VDVEVDLERLGPRLLLGKRSADADGAQASQLDAIAAGHRIAQELRSRSAMATSSRPWGPS